MADFKEVAFGYFMGDENLTFTLPKGRWTTKIKKFQKKYGDEITIRVENKNGSIVGELPVNWLSIRPPRKVSKANKERLKKQLEKARKKI